MDTAKLTNWLSSLPETFEVTPTTITIGDQTFVAASYKQNRTAPEGCQCPGPYVHEAIHAIGKLPKCKLRSRRVCFTVEGDNREWYVAAYSPSVIKGKQADTIDPKFAKFNPFGPTFTLCPWDDEKAMPAYRGQKIDHNAPKPYKRISMIVDKRLAD